MRYLKMNGAGNDFVIFDARATGRFELTPDDARFIADRDAGVGCDQIIALERSSRGDALMRIWNADGGEVEACGNAARCVGWLLMQEAGKATASIETVGGLLQAANAGPHRIAIDMGLPRLGWTEIPVARETDTVRMDFTATLPNGETLSGPGGVNMGNPHAVFFVANADVIPAQIIGPQIEHDAFFPERVNVGFAQILSPTAMRLRVWERGAGLTKACGTAPARPWLRPIAPV